MPRACPGFLELQAFCSPRSRRRRGYRPFMGQSLREAQGQVARTKRGPFDRNTGYEEIPELFKPFIYFFFIDAENFFSAGLCCHHSTLLVVTVIRRSVTIFGFKVLSIYTLPFPLGVSQKILKILFFFKEQNNLADSLTRGD